MKVFISWSGEFSKKVAEKLQGWIPLVLQSVEPFYSPESIEKGMDWHARLKKELSQCECAIVCLSKENWNSPWLNFEAGAISNSRAENVMIAVLLLDIEDQGSIKGPLSTYQATKIEKNDMRKLVLDINQKMEKPLEKERVEKTFESFWDEFEESIIKICEEEKAKQNDTPLLNQLKTNTPSPKHLSPSNTLAPGGGAAFVYSIFGKQCTAGTLAEMMHQVFDQIAAKYPQEISKIAQKSNITAVALKTDVDHAKLPSNKMNYFRAKKEHEVGGVLYYVSTRYGREQGIEQLKRMLMECGESSDSFQVLVSPEKNVRS